MKFLGFLCRKHPRYQAIREPMNACIICVRLWEMKERLRRTYR